MPISVSPGYPARLEIRTVMQSASISQMAQENAALMAQGMDLARGRVIQAITGEGGVFWTACFVLGAKAGRAFPMIYRMHLYQYMRAASIVQSTNHGNGLVSVYINLDLGSDQDYQKGFHHRALLAEGMPPPELRRKKKHFVLHPLQVPFPPGFTGQELFSTKETRARFWQQYIQSNAGTAEIRVRQGKGFRKIPVPTYDQVAAERLYQAWMLTGKAPQWRILEYGTHKSTDPATEPLHFTEFIETASVCYARLIYSAAARTITQISEQNQGAFRVEQFAGRGSYQPRTVVRGGQGRFASFRQTFDANIGNLTPCLGGL